MQDSLTDWDSVDVPLEPLVLKGVHPRIRLSICRAFCFASKVHSQSGNPSTLPVVEDGLNAHQGQRAERPSLRKKRLRKLDEIERVLVALYLTRYENSRRVSSGIRMEVCTSWTRRYNHGTRKDPGTALA